MTYQLVLMLTITMALTGCAQVWNRPGATQAQLDRDAAECRMIAAGIQAPAALPVAYPQTMTTLASAANGLQDTSNTLLGAAIRQGVMQDCLTAKGWVRER